MASSATVAPIRLRVAALVPFLILFSFQAFWAVTAGRVWAWLDDVVEELPLREICSRRLVLRGPRQ